MAKQPRQSDRIQCLECRKWFRALPSHLIRTHGMSDEDYRLKHAVPVGVPLVCKEWSANQSAKNIERKAHRTLTARGPTAGFEQRKSVKLQRAKQYGRLAKAGTKAAAAIDKTAARRAKIAPYPVTIAEAMDRLDCTLKAAQTFLSYCVRTKRLKRIGRGIYDKID